MSTEPINLVLEMLRAMRGDIMAIRETQAEHGQRLNDLARGIAIIRRDQGGDAETVAHLQAQVDRLREQIDRINRRLDLVD